MLKRISIFALVCLLFVGCSIGGESSQAGQTTSEPKTEAADQKLDDNQKNEDKQTFTVSTVKSEGKDGTYKVTGTTEGKVEKLYYLVEDGHNELVEETEVVVKDNAFTVDIKLEKTKLPSNGAVTFFVYTKNGTKMITQQTVTLQQFGS
jgi:hypothetical protein